MGSGRLSCDLSVRPPSGSAAVRRSSEPAQRDIDTQLYGIGQLYRVRASPVATQYGTLVHRDRAQPGLAWPGTAAGCVRRCAGRPAFVA
jgi:hypothetical protein